MAIRVILSSALACMVLLNGDRANAQVAQPIAEPQDQHLSSELNEQCEHIFANEGAIGLIPPPGMRPATAFAGFIDEGSGASILIVEMPEKTYDAVAEAFYSETLPNGLKLTRDSAELRLEDNTPAVLYQGQQTTGQGTFAKWVLLARNPDLTAVVTAQVPIENADAFADPLRRALESVTLRRLAPLDRQLDELPFRIADASGFRLSQTLAGSSALFIDPAETNETSGGETLVIVASSFSQSMDADHAATARGALAAIARMTDISIVEEGPSADAATYRRSATALEAGQPVSIVQHMLFENERGYLRTLCIFARQKDFAQRCDDLAASARFK